MSGAAALPDLFLTLCYGDDLAHLFGPTDAAARVQARALPPLARLLARLGVPATPRLALTSAPGQTGLRLLADGLPLPLPASDAERLRRLYAPDGRDLLPAVAAHVCRAAEANAARLLGERQCLRWIERATSEHADAALIGNYADAASAVLKALLEQGIAISDAASICRYLAEGLKSRRRTAAIAESAIARLQPATLDIDVNPAYAARLFGGVLYGPVSAAELPESAGNQFDMLRDGLFYELGVRIPPIRIVPDDELPAGSFRVRSGAAGGTPWGGLDPEQVLVNIDAPALAGLGLSAEPAPFPANDRPAAIIPAELRAEAEAAGASAWDAIGYLVLAVARDIRSNAGVLLDIDAVESSLAQLEQAFPELVYAALEKVSATDLTRVLRRLLAGDVSIRNFRSILERLLAYDCVASDLPREIVFDSRLAVDCRLDPQLEADLVDRYTEFVRTGLQLWLSNRSRGAGGTLPVRLLDPESIELPILQELAYRQARGLGRPLGAARLEAIREQVRRASRDEPAALLTVPQVATFLRAELHGEFPRLPVLSYQELSWDVGVQPIERLSS